MYSPVQYVDRPHHADVTAMTRVVDYDNDNYSKEIVTETVEETKTELVPQVIPERPPEETVTYINGKCTCCPYGYHIDVDFVRYCDALANGSYLRRLKKIKKTKRKLRKSMEIFLQQQEHSHQEMHSYPPPDVVHSSEHFISQVAQDDSAANVILDEIDSSVEATLASIDYMMRPPMKMRESSVESDDSLSPVSTRFNTFPRVRGYQEGASLTMNSRTDSTSSLSSQSTFSSENPPTGFTETTTNITKTRVTSAQLAETIATHLPEITQTTTVTSTQCPGLHISPASLQAIREAMAISLQRMRELEEQVKAIPVLQVRISVLKEEKRLLNLQLKAKNSRLNMRSIGVGDYSVDEPVESRVTETRSFLTAVQSPKPYGHSTTRTSVTNFLAAQQQRSAVRSVGVGDNSVDFFYLLQPHIATPYEKNIINQTTTHTHEKETVFMGQAQENTLRSSRVAFTQHLLNNQKPLTRTIGVGDGNVFDSKGSGYHIHEKELRTVIIGQAPGTTGKRNVGVECKVHTRDVGISYNSESEKPATRSIGVGVTDGSQGGISVKFEGEDWKTMVREVLKKNVRTVGVNCRMTAETRDVGVMHAWSDKRTVGCGTDTVDVIVRPLTSMQSVGVMAVADVRNQGIVTEKGWKLDACTNTPRKMLVPKGSNTESVRSYSTASMTEGTVTSSKVAQTEMKIFLATDVLRHTGCNTTNVRTQNTGVNTESKLMTSDKFNMDITFKDNSSNTQFNVADRGSNTSEQTTVETWETRSGGGGGSGDLRTSSQSYVSGGGYYKKYLPKKEDEQVTTIREVEISSSIPTSFEKSVRRTKRMSPAEVENMMGELERTVHEESISSSSWGGNTREGGTSWQREITPSRPSTDSEWSQTTRTMMLGGGGESSSMHGGRSSSFESSSSISGGGGGMGGGTRTVNIQRNIKKVRSGSGGTSSSDVIEYTPSRSVQEEEEAKREGRFMRLEEGDMEEEKEDDTVTEATEEYLVRKVGDVLDVMQIGGVPEHVIGGTDVTQHHEESSGMMEESFSVGGGRLTRDDVTAELEQVRRKNREALGSGIGESGGYTKTTKITVGGTGGPKKQRTIKKSVTALGGSGGSGGSFSSSSAEMLHSSGSGMSQSSSFESSGSRLSGSSATSGMSTSSGMSESYGTSFSSGSSSGGLVGSSSMSSSRSSGGSGGMRMGMMTGGGASGMHMGQSRLSAGEDFSHEEMLSGGGSYSMSTETRSSGGGPGMERSVKKTYISSSSSSGGVQSDGGGFHNRHAFSHGNVSDGQVETGLKSIMKRSTSEPQVKKEIKFAESVVGGYDTTSSEESDHSDSESTSSFEEGSYDGRQGNIVYSCEDDEAIAKGMPGAVMYDQNIRETYELSSEMALACKVLAKYLEDSTTVQTKELNACLNVIQGEWFKASSQKLSSVHMVEDYLSSFNEISRRLLEYVINIADNNGNTALHYAVSHCNFEVVSLLLDTGLVSVDKQNKAGYSVIMLAALSSVQTGKDVHVVKQLFDAGDVNAKASQAGQTALMLAVSHGRQEMVQMLLEAGAEVNIQDDDGSTALMCACEHGHTEIVKMLLAHPDCDANLTDNDGSTALSIAMEAGHKDVGVQLYAHVNFSKQSSPGYSRKHRKGSGSSTTSIPISRR